MENFIVGVVAALLFGWIGSLLGQVGMIIGVIFGVMVGFAQKPEEAKKKAEEEKDDKAKKFNGQNSEGVKSGAKTKEVEDYGIYVDVVTELIAACITSDGEIEESEIELAMSFIESDDLINNKKKSLDKLKFHIDDFHKERKKSKAVFKLKMTSVTHKAKELVSDLHKERVLVILDGMLDSISSGDRKESEEFVDKIKEIFCHNPDSQNKKLAAEQYILNSGDEEAINSLREMQRNPSAYKEKFKEASKGNSIMRTALGVFTGVIAANLVTSAIYQYQLNEALSSFDADLESMGGIDNFSIDQNNDFQSASSDVAEDEIPYSEDVNFDDVQVADAQDSGDVEQDAVGLDDDMDSDGGDDFDFFS